jgi:uncharacterized membrane protein (UPF0127 family)
MPLVCVLLMLVLPLCVVPVISCREKTDKPQPSEPTATFLQDQPLPANMLSVAGQTFTVELAFTQKSRYQGLMFRKELAPHAGMLFIFDRVRSRSFYMKNCLIDLDIIFIKQNGQITKITTMKTPTPGEPLKFYGSGAPIKYVLELPAGTAEKLELRTGQKIDIPPRIRQIIPEPD